MGTPDIDRLAAEGTRYSFARSASPWTLPAHTSMLTGQLPVTHKVVDDGLVLDPSGPSGGVAFSNALEATIGVR